MSRIWYGQISGGPGPLQLLAVERCVILEGAFISPMFNPVQPVQVKRREFETLLLGLGRIQLSFPHAQLGSVRDSRRVPLVGPFKIVILSFFHLQNCRNKSHIAQYQQCTWRQTQHRCVEYRVYGPSMIQAAPTLWQSRDGHVHANDQNEQEATSAARI